MHRSTSVVIFGWIYPELLSFIILGREDIESSGENRLYWLLSISSCDSCSAFFLTSDPSELYNSEYVVSIMRFVSYDFRSGLALRRLCTELTSICIGAVSL